MLNIEYLLNVVRIAGDLALDHQNQNKVNYTNKPDNSPVTEADIAVNNIYIEHLTNKYPDIPIISEENPHQDNKKNLGCKYFLIDPIDGTESFINKSPNFVSQIALIENGRPTFAAIYNPARDELYYSNSKQSYLIHNGTRKAISVKENSPPKLYISHRLQKKAVFDEIKKLDFQSHHTASSYKFCILARGDADLIPYLNSIHSWDIAPPDLIIKTAGGIFLNLQGRELTYNDPSFNCENFIAASKEEHFHTCLNAIKQI
ncbi:MAG: 3'(2'),5'-bisphosphate nucleotidase CysQ [Rickettsiales bacterium]|jgi:3'(2'), 5'-bisphosphate nucleotidase|nr:3'(2'),5'-bisphosphate nucleotidase CysQ [Rickettsiales bacterium]